MKIMSWNVNSLRARLGHVERVLREEQPDVLALQETKSQDPDFPAEVFDALGYRTRFAGQKSYNGVALISRAEPEDLITEMPVMADPARRVIAATVDGVRVIGLYVPNGQAVGSDKYDYKMDWLGHLKAWLREELQHHPDLVVVGDFNIAPDDRDVHDPEAWRDRILCSVPERDAMQGLLALGLCDTFRLHQPDGGHYSWWDYRGGGLRENQGLRIDLVLASEALEDRCTEARIHSDTRTWDRPSDHAPVSASFSTA
jgi:exodeoxyribonuclease III